ncbi:MAG TPA: integrase family protein [Pseudaminobacter sp.]|nr:integrase family protein [Pseudaminobacter sp.]
MKMKLTVLAIPSLPEGNYTDAACAGLTLRVGAKRRTWSVYYRIGGKLKQTTIGYWLPDNKGMGLADARKAAADLADRVNAGAPVEPPPPHPRQGSKTLGEVIDLYEKMRRAKGAKGTKTIDAALRTVRNNLGAHLKLPAKQFSKADLRAIRDEIHKRAPQQASRFLAYCGPIWRWMEQEDHVEVDVVRSVIKIASVTKRDRTLTHAEIKAIWHACDHVGTSRSARNFGKLVKFLLVTAQRRDEGASLKYGHILDGVWRQAENKSSRAHRLKLPPLALDLVGDGVAQEFVFMGDPGKKISGFSKHKKKLDEVSGTSGWVLHDLRRTAASGMQELGVDPSVIEATLNHAIVGVGAHYLHATVDRAKAHALAVWASEVERIVGAKRAVS